MIPVSLSVCLHLSVSSSLALSLPQSSPLNPERLDSSLLRGSRGGYRRKATDSPQRDTGEPRIVPQCLTKTLYRGAKKHAPSPLVQHSGAKIPPANARTKKVRLCRTFSLDFTRFHSDFLKYSLNIPYECSSSPNRLRRFRGSGCSCPCRFRTWFLPPCQS